MEQEVECAVEPEQTTPATSEWGRKRDLHLTSSMDLKLSSPPKLLESKERGGGHGHLLCILIPYRDRLEELQQLIPHLSVFLDAQGVDRLFIVLNQTDVYRFNRASLFNVGWLEADRLGSCDYIALHDVDILPLNPQLDYSFPGVGTLRHIAAGQYHPIKRYDYPNFIGGVLIIALDDYRRVDGMSNQYWGWGLEDDEFFMRLKEANLSVQRPENLTTGRRNTFKHLHATSRKRDYAMIGNQRKMTRRRDRKSGLSTVQYEIANRSIIEFGTGLSASVLHIHLHCNSSWTPYCVGQELPRLV